MTVDADSLSKEADALVEVQRNERGYQRGKLPDGKPCLLMDPYVVTPQREARAARIIALRRQAAALEHGRPR